MDLKLFDKGELLNEGCYIIFFQLQRVNYGCILNGYLCDDAKPTRIKAEPAQGLCLGSRGGLLPRTYNARK